MLSNQQLMEYVPDNLRRQQQVTPVFKVMQVQDDGASMMQGRPVYKEMEVVEIQIPGNTLTRGVFPVDAFANWEIDPETQFQYPIAYKDRWPEQYERFKKGLTQSKSGTPLAEAPFLTELQRNDMRNLAIYTVEDLAALDSNALKAVGPRGRELKNRAMAYLETAAVSSGGQRQAAQIEELMTRLTHLEEENKRLATMAQANVDRAMTDQPPLFEPGGVAPRSPKGK